VKKYLVIIGHLSMLVTAILTLIFYKERVLYVDCGQQLFEMINDNNYKVYIARYSMVINQTIPLIAIKLNLPLKWIMIIYSMSFVIIYYICFLLSVYKLKNLAAGMGIALAPLLIRLLFGHCMGETWLGLGYAALFYAALNYKDHIQEKISAKRIPYYLLLIFLALLNYFIHPGTLFLLGFCVGYTMVKNKAFLKIWPYALSLIILACYSYKFFFTTFGYEENFFNELKRAPQNISHFFQSSVIEFFLRQFWTNYVLFFIVFVFAVASHIYSKKYLMAIFVISYPVLYFIVASFSFFHTTGDMLTEARLLPLIFMVIIPSIEMIKKNKVNYIMVGSIFVMLTWAYFQLYSNIKLNHTRRINYYENLLAEVAKYPERKFYTFKEKCAQSPANSWGIAVETLLLSSINGKENGKTIFMFPKGERLDPVFMNEKCNFLWVGWWIYYNEDHFNKKYFDLGCGPYRQIENPECDPDRVPLLQ
jgi:hypothetical protein